MGELLVPLDPKEVVLLKRRFERTVSIVNRSIDLLKSEDAHVYIAEGHDGKKPVREIVDGIVVRAMQGGITAMYRDLQTIGESEFANSVLNGRAEEKSEVPLPEAFRASKG